MNVLSDLLEVTATCIGDTVQQTREALEDHGHTCGAAPVRFPTAQALRAFLETDTRPAGGQLLEQLSHPALTGISRPDLEQLTERLAPRQLAQAERLSYQRRGGPRRSGTRSGVFHQKISNRERVLVAVLYQRRLCTMDVLADLLQVCRSSIGNAIRETRPLLEQAGHTSTPAPTGYRTAAELLASVTPRPPRRTPARRHVDSLRLHRARNVLAKVPIGAQAEVKAAYWSIFDDIDQPAGQAAVDEATRRAEAFATCYQRTYPAAVGCLTSTLGELTAHLRFPPEHWQRIRHTNLLERTFGETRRRTKVIGRLPGERSCLKLVWAVLDRASRGWRGLTYTPAATRLLQDLRRDLLDPPTDQADPEPATTAA
jgi:mutator family transposase